MKAAKPSQKNNKGWTLIELLAVMFIVAVTSAIFLPVAKKYGGGVGIGAGFITIIICVFIVIQFYRWSWRSEKRRLQELREKYQAIYRINALPVDKKISERPLVPKSKLAILVGKPDRFAKMV